MPNNSTDIVKWGAEDHPSVELLRQHEEGTLPADLNHELEKHLLDCELCTDVLDGMALTDRHRTNSNVYKISQRIKTRIRKQRKRAILHGFSDWRVLVAIIMLFCLLGLLVFFYYMKAMPAVDDSNTTPQQIDAPPVQEVQDDTIYQL